MVQFTFYVRPQFTFRVDDITFATILAAFVADPALDGLPTNEAIRVNVVGLSLIKLPNSQCNLVKLVTGPPNPEAVTSPSTTVQNQRVRDILRVLDVKYTEKNIIQIASTANASGIPGIYRLAYTRLVCAGIHILASYLGEPVSDIETGLSEIFEIPQNQFQKAIQILQQPFEEPDLCISLTNINQTGITHGTCCNCNDSTKLCNELYKIKELRNIYNKL